MAFVAEAPGVSTRAMCSDVRGVQPITDDGTPANLGNMSRLLKARRAADMAMERVFGTFPAPTTPTARRDETADRVEIPSSLHPDVQGTTPAELVREVVQVNTPAEASTEREDVEGPDAIDGQQSRKVVTAALGPAEPSEAPHPATAVLTASNSPTGPKTRAARKRCLPSEDSGPAQPERKKSRVQPVQVSKKPSVPDEQENAGESHAAPTSATAVEENGKEPEHRPLVIRIRRKPA